MKDHLKFWGFMVLALVLIVTGMVCCQKTEKVDWKAEYEDLEMDYNNKAAKLEKEQENVRKLEAELADIKVKYYADELYINGSEDGSIRGINDKYRNLYLYATYAEEILIANGIEFRMVEGGLDYDSLRGEE